jgi:HK97 family phage major capsid protein
MGLKERHNDAVARHDELILRMGAWAQEMDDLEDDGKLNSAQYKALEEKVLEAVPEERTLRQVVKRNEALFRSREQHTPDPISGRRGSTMSDNPVLQQFGQALLSGLEDVRTGRAAAAYVDPQTAMRTDAEQRALTDFGVAGSMVPLQFGPAGFTLRASSVVLGLPGIHIVPMHSDRMRFPRIAGVDAAGADIAQAGVLENVSITDTTPDVDAVDLVAVKFAVFHTLSSEFVEDASQDALALFAQNALIQLGLKVDYGMLEGTGASQLVGIRNTVGISTTSVAGTPADFDKFSDTLYAAELANANPTAWVMHPRSWNTLAKIKTGLASDKSTLLEPDPQSAARTLLGHPVHQSTQITLVEGTAGSWVAAVDPSQLIVGVRRAPQIEFSRDAAFQSDSVVLKATCRYAFGVLNPTGVSIATDVRA